MTENKKMVTMAFPMESEISEVEAINWVEKTIDNHPEWVTDEPLIQARMIEILFGRKYAVAYLAVLSSGHLEESANGGYFLHTLPGGVTKLMHWELCERALNGATRERCGESVSIFSIRIKPIEGEEYERDFIYTPVSSLLI